MYPSVRDRCTECPAEPACVFSNLSGDARVGFQSIAEGRFYSAGVDVVDQGETARGLFIVQSGLVKLLHLSACGKQTIVDMIAPAGIFGLTEVITGSAYRASAKTLEPSQLEYVPRTDFVSFLLDHPEVAIELVIWLGLEVEKVRHKYCEMAAGLPLPVRLLRRLRDLSEPCGVSRTDGVMLSASLTVKDLAHSLGCSRQWASKTLGDIEDVGLIKRSGRRIILTASAPDRHSA